MEKSSQSANSGPSFGQGLELAKIIINAIGTVIKQNKVDEKQVQAVIEKPGAIFQLVENLFAKDGKVNKKSDILQVISGGEILIIEALDGKEYIFDAKKVFKSYIDGDFRQWGLNQPSPATAETLLDVSEMVGNGTLVQIFTDISSDLERLVMTQAQIIRFCEKHPTWLRQEGYATFFLTKISGEYFVVNVNVRDIDLSVGVSRLRPDYISGYEYHHRVVTPHIIDLLPV